VILRDVSLGNGYRLVEWSQKCFKKCRLRKRVVHSRFYWLSY